ncbi:hypothetical protein E4T56_gene9332, partial [Termitomyces sp. T112]
LLLVATMDQAEHHRHENQRGHGGKDKTADDGPAERAVIRTGRKRVDPASSAACSALPLAASLSRAKLTTSTELAVATPMHRIAPVSAGTERVVPVANRIHAIPASAAGNAETMAAGSDQLWKFTTISR